MPFMQVEVSGPEEWIILDGPCGGELIPCDVCGHLPTYAEFADEYEGDNLDEDYADACFAVVRDYCENPEVMEIEQVSGYAGRLSAPGYLDCTEWLGPFDSAEEARREVLSLYDLCPACEDDRGSVKGDNPACNFYHY